MKFEEIKTEEYGVVKIWKMNFGFKADMGGYIASVDQDSKSKAGVKMNVNFRNMRLYWLVFGIYEAEKLLITAPSNLEVGMTEAEILERFKKIRMIEGETAELLQEAIIKLNSPKVTEEDDIKKA